MEIRIGLREANQQLAKYVKAAEEGHEVVITRRGEPVARLLPAKKKRHLSAERKASHERMVALMKKGMSLGGYRFRRDDAYER